MDEFEPIRLSHGDLQFSGLALGQGPLVLLLRYIERPVVVPTRPGTAGAVAGSLLAAAGLFCFAYIGLHITGSRWELPAVGLISLLLGLALLRGGRSRSGA